MMYSIILPALLGLTALASDGIRLMSAQSKLSGVVDNAALAGAFAAENQRQNRVKITREFLAANADEVLPAQINPNYKLKFDDNAQELFLEVTADIDLFFGGLFGMDETPVRASSVTSYATSEIDPVTLAFALDVSGSMDWASSTGEKKIEVLKDATALLFDAVEEGSKRPDLLKEAIRTGMSAYNTEVVSVENMSWGWHHLENSVDNLIADGGTNSSPALLNSYNQILEDRDFRKANDPDFDQSTLNEYVLFMTDGDNNQPEWDAASAQVCWDMRQDGIEIYSVAFTAPEKGQLLLWNCASWDNPNEDSNPSANNGNGNGSDPSKCMNNGSKGKGKALGHCKGNGDEKSKYYFDADDAQSFKAAFVDIGYEISKSEIRIKR